MKHVLGQIVTIALLADTGYLPARAQPYLPDSLRQPVRVHVTGDAALVPGVREQLNLELIAAEARLADEDAVWILDMTVVRSDLDTAMVALALITSQPYITSEPPQRSGNVESGAWVEAYVRHDLEKRLRLIHDHDVLVVPASEAPNAVTELADRFRERQLEPIKRLWLERIGHE